MPDPSLVGVDPDVKLNVHGKAYKLQCRRTASNESEDNDAITLEALRSWMRQATSCTSREAHQRIGVDASLRPGVKPEIDGEDSMSDNAFNRI